MLTDAQLLAIRKATKERIPFDEVNHGARYTDAERRFMVTVDHYKAVCRRPFPTWAEVLALLLALGYREPDESEAVEAAMTRRAERLRRDRCSVCGRAG